MNPDKRPIQHPIELDDVKEADKIVTRYNEGAADISDAQALEAERVIFLRNIEFMRDTFAEQLNRIQASALHPDVKAELEDMYKNAVARLNENISELGKK